MKIDQDVFHQMAIALCIALLGVGAIYSTFARPDAGPTPNAVSMITVASADRAGATVTAMAPAHPMATWAFK
jgi:hypothetical protein